MAFKEVKTSPEHYRRRQVRFFPTSKSHPRFYDSQVDYELLEGMGIRYVMHEKWQIGLFHDDLEGKFLWYPSAGTLVFESADGFFKRIGEKGDFLAGGWSADQAREYITEDVYNEIIKVVEMQQSQP